jgi:hypothetical protein
LSYRDVLSRPHGPLGIRFGDVGMTLLVLLAVELNVATGFDDEHVFGALRAGASGFLVKDVEPDELLQAVRVVARGDALLTPSVTRSLIAAFTSGRGDPAPPSGGLAGPVGR